MSDRDDRERPSWRDIDKMRDSKPRRERHRGRHRSDGGLSGYAQKSYRAALERAFDSGKLAELAETLNRKEDPPAARGDAAPAAAEPSAAPAEEKAARPSLPPAPRSLPRNPVRESKKKLLSKLEKAEGREAVSKAADAYLAKFKTLPDDYDLLTKVLVHKSDARVLDVLSQLASMIPKEKPRRARSLLAQLRYLEETHVDPDVKARAAEVRAML